MKEKESPEGKMCSPKAGEGEMRVRREYGVEIEGSISNFSAEFTVDSFPIRQG